MSIQDLSAQQLNNLENNYLAKGVTVGGRYTLAEVRLEKLRRLPSTLDTVATAQRIIELANASDDGLTTYGELWASFNPDKPWKGNATQQIVGNALGRVTAYCITNKMPIITTLVVRSGSRTLSDEAIINITNEARGLGVETGSDPRVFVESQMAAAKALTQFPSEEPAGET